MVGGPGETRREGGEELAPPLAHLSDRVRPLLLPLLLFSGGLNLLVLTTSLYLLQVFDRVLSSGSVETLVALSVIALIALIAWGLLDYARRQMLAGLGAHLDRDLSPKAFAAGLHGQQAGLPASPQALRDVQELRRFLSGEGLLVFLDAPFALVFLAVLYLLHPLLGLVTTLGAGVLMAAALITSLATARAEKRSGQAQRADQRWLEGLYGETETVNGLGMVEALSKRLAAVSQNREATQLGLSKTGDQLGSLSRFFRMAMQILIIAVGATLVLSSAITAGAMIAASILQSRALSPVERAQGAWQRFRTAREAFGRLNSLLKQSSPGLPGQAAESEATLPNPKGLLSAEHLTLAVGGRGGTGQPEAFGPDRKAKFLLNDVSFEAPPGALTAVIGPSGAGKSTLARLLVGLMRPQRGTVRLDGFDIGLWPPDALARHVGYLPQAPRLLPGTLGENIARFGPLDRDDLITASRWAGVEDLIGSLPAGFETPYDPQGKTGVRLSGGQIQRVALARALYGKPRALVLDEPMANLDGEGEAALRNALAIALKNDRSVVLITHNKSWVTLAHQVIVLRDGSIYASGTRDQVFERLTKGATVLPLNRATPDTEEKDGRGAPDQDALTGSTKDTDPTEAPEPTKDTGRKDGPDGDAGPEAATPTSKQGTEPAP